MPLLGVLGLYDCAIADLDYSPVRAAGLVLSAHHQQTEKERCGRLQPQRLFSDGLILALKMAFSSNKSPTLSTTCKFRSVLAKDVMTPRTVVRILITETLKFFDKNREMRFSRIPLYENESEIRS